MTDLSSFYKTDLVDDHTAADVNNLIAAVMRSEYKNVETLTGTRALLDTDTPIQRYECGASDRTVTCPAADTVNNHPFWIINASAAARILTVKNAAGTVTIAALTQGQGSMVLPDGAGGYLTAAANSLTKASGAELDTGTDDANYATAKAIKDSHNVPSVAPGTLGNVLTSNGTDWESTAPTGGGSGSAGNALINGGFDFFQRIAPATATAMSDDVYNAPDRWYSLVQGANATINRDAGIGTSQNSCKLVAGGTTNRYGIAQIVEAVNSIPYRGQTVIAQVKVKPVNNAGSGTRKYRIAILEWTGTANTVTSELVADWTSGTFTTAGFFASTTITLVGCATVTATHNTETALSVSGTVSASCNNLIVFVWTEDAPTHASDYVLIGEAGLYTGSSVQTWNPRPITQELMLCQRYYEKNYQIDAPPGTNDVVGAAAVSSRASDQIDRFGIPFKVTKFATPSVSVYSLEGAINKIRDASIGGDLAAATGWLGQNAFFIYPTANTTAGHIYGAYWVAIIEL